MTAAAETGLALPAPLAEFAVGFAAAAVATELLARLFAARSPRVLVDPLPDAPLEELARKRQRRPVPLIGGLALLVAWVLAGADAGGGLVAVGLPALPGGAVAATVLLAFATGLSDDLAPGGLRPGPKLCGQLLAGVPLGFAVHSAAAGAPALLLPACALGALASAVVLNAVNTFDNANGTAAGLFAAALALAAPGWAGALAGFLPHNTSQRAFGERDARAPRAYLGDSGSHLVGAWILVTPIAWPALTLPLVDLARLAVERVRRGSRPWIGDREHLAHRLEARGWGEGAVLLALLVVAAPSVLVGGLGVAHGRPDAVALGCAVTALVYLAALRLARREPDPRTAGRIEPSPRA